MRMNDAQQFYVVGVHGAPTPETAPHGFAFRRPGQRWTFGFLPAAINVDAEWYPLPAPPTEQAPPPEPVARWTSHYDNRGMWVLLCEGSPNFTKDEAAHILKTLNTLDRDGVAWGPGRPMSELPETGRVLVAFTNGHVGTWNTWDLGDRRLNVTGWWPLPEVTP